MTATRKHNLVKKAPAKKSSTAKRKIPSSKFPKSQSKIPSRKLPTGTAKIPSRKIPHAPSKAKKKAIKPPLPDRPKSEEERHNRILELKEELKTIVIPAYKGNTASVSATGMIPAGLPTITSPGDLSNSEGTQVNLSFNATDPDSDPSNATLTDWDKTPALGKIC